MKKLLVLLSLLVMPFALAGNKESVKEVKAEVDTNATITIGENTFSRVTTSNMDKVKDGAKVILVTENSSHKEGPIITTTDRNVYSFSISGYTLSAVSKETFAFSYIFTVSKTDSSYELKINDSKLYCKAKVSKYTSTIHFMNNEEKGTQTSSFSSTFEFKTGFYGDKTNDYPIFVNQNRTIFGNYGANASTTGKCSLYFYTDADSSYKNNPNYGTPCIYVLNEASKLTNEEKATVFVNKWKAYDDNFCGNLKDETKRAEMSALIAEYDALDLEVKALLDAAIIKDGVTVANQIEYVRNSLAITKSENTSQSLVNIITTNNSTMTYVLILSIATISLISYAFVLKTKKNK